MPQSRTAGGLICWSGIASRSAAYRHGSFAFGGNARELSGLRCADGQMTGSSAKRMGQSPSSGMGGLVSCFAMLDAIINALST